MNILITNVHIIPTKKHMTASKITPHINHRQALIDPHTHPHTYQTQESPDEQPPNNQTPPPPTQSNNRNDRDNTKPTRFQNFQFVRPTTPETPTPRLDPPPTPCRLHLHRRRLVSTCERSIAGFSCGRSSAMPPPVGDPS